MNYIFCLITNLLNPLFIFLYENKLATSESIDCKYKIYVGNEEIEKNNLKINYYTSSLINEKNSYWIPSETEDVHIYNKKIKEVLSVIFKDLENQITYKNFDILIHSEEITKFLNIDSKYYAYVENSTLYLLDGYNIYSFNIEQSKLDKKYFTDIMNRLKDKIIKKYVYEEEFINDFLKKVHNFLDVNSTIIKLFLLYRYIFIFNE